MPPTLRGPDEVGSREASRKARLALEHALFSLRELPEHVGAHDRETERDRLLRALVLLYVVGDSEPWQLAHQQGLDEAALRAHEAALAWARLAEPREGAAPTDEGLARRVREGLRGAHEALRAASDRVAALRATRRDRLEGGPGAEPVPPPEPFRVCRGTPRWFALQRTPLTPFVDVGAPSPSLASSGEKPTLEAPRTEGALRALGASFAALEAAGEHDATPSAEAEARAREAAIRVEEPPPADWAYEPASHELELVRSLARESLEELGLARHLRTPNTSETWLDQEPFEERLLTHLDAFFSLGPVALPLAPLAVAEADPPDPDRAFALSLVLGSLAGADAALVLALALTQGAPELLPGFREGLALAPRAEPGGAPIDLALRDLVLSRATSTGELPRRPDLVALALSVLDARGTLDDETVSAALACEEPVVQRELARALGYALPRELAIDVLETRLLAREPEIARRALASLVLRRAPHVASRVRALAADAGPLAAEAARLLALVGAADDHELVARWLTHAPSPALARAAGRMGHLGLLDPLASLLLHDDEEIVEAAAESLERIVGAGLFETTDEPWDIALPDEARDRGAPLPTRPVRRVVRAPEPWRAELGRFRRTREGARDPSVKWRGGQPFHPLSIVAELMARDTPPARRLEAHEELELLTGALSTFRCDDWVARQREALEQARAGLERVGPAGAWSFRLVSPSSPPPRGGAGSSAPPRRASELPPAPPRPPEASLRPSPWPLAAPAAHAHAPQPAPATERRPSSVPPRAPALPSFLLERGASLGATLAPFDPVETEPGAPQATRPVLPFQQPAQPAPRPIGATGLPFASAPAAPLISAKPDDAHRGSGGTTMMGVVLDKPALPFATTPAPKGDAGRTADLGPALAEASAALPFEASSLGWEGLADAIVDFEKHGGAPGPRSLELGIGGKADLDRARMRFLKQFLHDQDTYKRFLARCDELRKKP